MQKTYFGFATDHTGSMTSIRRQAARDYNSTISSVKVNAQATGQDVVVSHIKIGHNHSAAPFLTLRNSSLNALEPINEDAYDVSAGSTRLFDAVVELVNELKRAPDADDENVAFAVMITTDGGNNAGSTTGPELARLIDQLQRTDKWTFVFRVPKDGYRELARMGIPDGNIMVWDTTSKGMEAATKQNTQAMGDFFTARAAGTRSTKSFYANLKDVTVEEVRASLEDISAKVQLFNVPVTDHEMQIRDFVEMRCLNGDAMKKGAAFYQLVKSEDKVQASKKIIIRDKATKAVYYGAAARQMIGLPSNSDVRLKPEDLGNFDVFIQSTSVNRKVQKNTQILYWADVGVGYKEGPSARI